MRVKREVLTLKFDAKTLNIIVTKAVAEPAHKKIRLISVIRLILGHG